MSTTEQRIAANRANALQSTGPLTEDGKLIASQNATRHGILSTRLLLEDECRTEFEAVLEELSCSLKPVGTMELVLVERIAITLWRQRRLVQAECAQLALSRTPKCIATTVSKHLGRSYGSELNPEDLLNIDRDRERWCRKVLAELEALETLDLKAIEASAPLTLGQLKADASEDHQDVSAFLRDHKNGVAGYLGQLMLWCREQIGKAEAQPQIQALAVQVRAKRLILDDDALELMSRYQTTLDNQLYKALRALREAQEWRLKLLEATPAAGHSDTEPEQQAV